MVRTLVYFGSTRWEFLPRLGYRFPFSLSYCLSSNGDLNLNTGIDVDDDLLDDLGRGVEAGNEELAHRFQISRFRQASNRSLAEDRAQHTQ